MEILIFSVVLIVMILLFGNQNPILTIALVTIGWTIGERFTKITKSKDE